MDKYHLKAHFQMNCHRKRSSSKDYQMQLRSTGLILFLMFSVFGCNSIGQRQDASWHEGNYVLAKMKIAVDERDPLLRKVALNASKAGHGEIAEKAINDIKYVDIQSSTASKCAYILFKRGKRLEAVKIAKSIKHADLRRKTLDKLEKLIP